MGEFPLLVNLTYAPLVGELDLVEDSAALIGRVGIFSSSYAKFLTV